MRFRKTLTFLMLAMALVFALAAAAQQKPFTQEQVSNMVRDGFGDESGAKLIEQRGIDFAPSEDFIQTLKAAGASEAFLNGAARRQAARARQREEAAEPGAGFRPAGGPSAEPPSHHAGPGTRNRF